MKKTTLLLTAIALISFGLSTSCGESEKQSVLLDNSEDSTCVTNVTITTGPVMVDTTTTAISTSTVK